MSLSSVSSVSRRVLGLAVALLAAVGCSNDNSTTSPSTTRTQVTETFTSNLNVQGSVWRFVTAEQTGTLTATLTSSDQPTTTVGFGIGLRNGSGNGCFVTKDVLATAGSQPQLSAAVDAGTYCVKLFDPAPGQLQRPMNFTVTISYP